ncbi:ACP phosphodiesterase [Paraflavitalea pollutisoli]|uniref:acyl carrier protein phosphodiesterase n=1 Tax=Paraflavitalea pollutisoli TaxID=3034143 RepID=UPI0023EABF53|nr:ACP phosphodiesterase [Paraflavitalea sp. H1-2-19X]
MNYLAHAYLSFNLPGILVGNLISDFVKGKKQFDYPPDIQKGIVLHRAIDTFTDEHTATARAKEVFRPFYRLYSGAFVDVVYDHFLANDPTQFAGNDLFDFSQQVYHTLDQQERFFPTPFKMMFPYMKQHNWLYNYRQRHGIEKSFEGVVRRAAYLTESRTAYQLFEDQYDELRACYDDFFPSLRAHALATLQSFDHKAV